MLYYVYLVLTLVVFILSLYRFRQLEPSLKLFSAIIGLTLLTEFLADFGRHLFGYKTNIHIYNVYMFVVFWLYGLYFYMSCKGGIRKLIIFFLALFPLFCIYSTVRFFTLYRWNSYVSLTGSIFVIIFALAYCYQLFVSKQVVRFAVNPGFWIAVALLFFYAVNLPFTGIYNFLTVNYPKLADTLIDLLDVVNIITYCLFGYAFVCRRLQ